MPEVIPRRGGKQRFRLVQLRGRSSNGPTSVERVPGPNLRSASVLRAPLIRFRPGAVLARGLPGIETGEMKAQ